MKLERHLISPPTYGKIVNEYLQIIEKDKKYKAFTLNEYLEIIECEGFIQNNNSWNYHNNYDDSENELYVVINGKETKQFFMLDENKIKALQEQNIRAWKGLIELELKRLNSL